ncbi:MAG: hypothetical protein A2655_03910 [Candidatus Yanofskybacteria bacterium RIFCSPHIGHO2_01_FULL_43_42]|uniref:Uncharacterized protein n=1 Tax=Candidatus Yanofskybacteria bacterium RIFCSPLOWO2_01_FULL_43_22 TaxID=1802695 RepID=A0A1F8GD21_9BACT|nr:MAG: hypothetical protein A2655_03910 [Candidatus Yanofskybacteria bacterium RIFCSPHIGHO2_01_FULL_43_42]OGN12639.1 MAG: hypothetical protein A3D48_01260 [Candidatus Yanofskybacteria bacterium RIFCSPHIGHO2_02_FULL_43_17]OGN23262.1 MAG: hypothetical protein A3A13_04025 [Candidatus Yanofskybacteria bacterium RIFCSPLOWO2_01_FULL_43_22]
MGSNFVQSTLPKNLLEISVRIIEIKENFHFCKIQVGSFLFFYENLTFKYIYCTLVEVSTCTLKIEKGDRK